MKSPKAPNPIAPSAVATARAPDVADAAKKAKQKATEKYDFARTIIRSPLDKDGMKATLG